MVLGDKNYKYKDGVSYVYLYRQAIIHMYIHTYMYQVSAKIACLVLAWLA